MEMRAGAGLLRLPWCRAAAGPGPLLLWGLLLLLPGCCEGGLLRKPGEGKLLGGGAGGAQEGQGVGRGSCTWCGCSDCRGSLRQTKGAAA